MCGGHVDPHLLVNYLPLLFHLCIQMGLPLEAPSPSTSSSFCTCGESYSRKTPPTTPARARVGQTANAPENALSKEQKFGGRPQKIPDADEHATFGRDDVRLPIARLAAYAKPFVA